MSFDRVPVIPEPPHDPTSLLVDGRVGWPIVSSSDVETSPSGALRLSPIADSLPAMANAKGTFGNLVLPSNVALTADGHLLQLDRSSSRISCFDPCACAFVPLPCTDPARYGVAPHGIGVWRGSLFVCDPVGKRVRIFALNGLAPRGELVAPGVSFEPHAIAFDGAGRAFVTDRSAGLVHRFDPQGNWRRALTGFAEPTWIAVDRCDRLFVVVGGPAGDEVRVTDIDGSELHVEMRADRLAVHFAGLPFEVDEAGNLRLGPLCSSVRTAGECGAASEPRPDWFDEHGQPIAAHAAAMDVQFPAIGEIVIGPLDSRIAQCVWHRLLLGARVPEGARLTVATFTADEAYTADQVAALAEWSTWLEVSTDGSDGLIRSAPGRYLWLRLSLASSGSATVEVHRVEIEFPRIGSRRYLPAVFGAEPVSADFTDRFLALFDATMRGIERQIDTQASLFDPASAPVTRVGGAPVDFLSWLASWVGVSLDRRWTEAQRRRFLKAAGSLFDCRGTLAGLRAQLELILGFDAFDRCCLREPPPSRCGRVQRNCAPAPRRERWMRPPLVLEHFRLRRWLYVGAGRLGAEAVLWGNRIVNRTSLDANARVGGSALVTTQDPLRDPHHVYAHKFTVFVPCRYRDSAGARRSLEALLKSESPAHSRHYLTFVEPRFRIGVQSMIGFDAVVGRVPIGVRLGATNLRGSAVLTSRLSDGEAPFSVGRQGRVGTTTRIG